MICQKFKRIETRTWATQYRGDILICSSLTVHQDYKKYYKEFPPAPGSLRGQFGKALCIAKLVDCRPMVILDGPAALCDYYPGAVAWELTDIRLVDPINITGHLNLFDVDDNLIRISEDQEWSNFIGEIQKKWEK